MSDNAQRSSASLTKKIFKNSTPFIFVLDYIIHPRVPGFQQYCSTNQVIIVVVLFSLKPGKIQATTT